MGGPKKQKKQIQTASDITQRQLSLAEEQARRERESYQEMQRLRQPLVQQQTALASGNRQEAMGAILPILQQIGSGFHAARQQILNTLPPGAARDRALADLDMQAFSNIGAAQAATVGEAPKILASLGSESGGFGLQQLGAALAGMTGASQTNTTAAQIKAQQQASWLDFFSNLAGVAGGPAAKKVFKT